MRAEFVRKINALKRAGQPCLYARLADQELVYSVQDGALGSSELWALAKDRALEVLGRDWAREVALPNGQLLYLQAFAPASRVIIAGAVHITQHLAPVMQAIGYSITLIDPRPAFANQERFNDIEVVQDWPQDVLSACDFNSATAVMALSHDPKIDDPLLMMALTAQISPFYVGALGSKKSNAKREQRLSDQGLKPTQINQIFAPIGLDIYSQSPAEIAVSIAGQVVQVRNTPV